MIKGFHDEFQSSIKMADENGDGYKEISALEMLEKVRDAESVTRSKEKIEILEV